VVYSSQQAAYNAASPEKNAGIFGVMKIAAGIGTLL
jgi:hypothetical protein